VNNYAVEVKPSARKELEALLDNVLSRVVREVESLGHTPGAFIHSTSQI